MCTRSHRLRLQIIDLFIIMIFEITLQSHLKSQTEIDFKSLPRPDCASMPLYQKFDSHKNKLLVVPNSIDDSIVFKRMFEYEKSSWDEKAIKYESQLTDSDYAQPMLIYGPIQGFKHWEKFNIPILKIKDGFSFQNKLYTNTDDGLNYLSEYKLVYTGNSSSVIWKLQTTMLGSYEYFVIKNGLLSLLRIPATMEIDLENIREINYNRLSSNFYDLYISKKLKNTISPDSIVYSICSVIHLPLPKFKIKAFMHSDPNAARLFSNFFFMIGCDILADSVKFGTVSLDCIHSVGLDYGMLRHETFHILWESQLGPTGANPFFSEGIETYYEFLLDSTNVIKSQKVVQKHKDLDITNLVLKGDNFWNAPSENGSTIAYSISGLFVKYLIDTWGMDKFKQFYKADNTETGFKNIYHCSVGDLIDGYKKFIANN